MLSRLAAPVCGLAVRELASSDQLVPFGEPGASDAPFWLSGKFAVGPVRTVSVFGHTVNAIVAKNSMAIAPTIAMIGLVTSVL
jgi:hypothetical protein